MEKINKQTVKAEKEVRAKEVKKALKENMKFYAENEKILKGAKIGQNYICTFHGRTEVFTFKGIVSGKTNSKKSIYKMISKTGDIHLIMFEDITNDLRIMKIAGEELKHINYVMKEKAFYKILCYSIVRRAGIEVDLKNQIGK